MTAPCGLGWRHPHHQALLQQRPALAFLEVHSENFFADGGAGIGLLLAAREHYALSLHGVGLGLGSAAGLDPWHLAQLQALVQRVQPQFVSDHACFARAFEPAGGHWHAANLLPIAFDDDSLDRLVRHVQQVQERLARPILVENLSAYVDWAHSDWAEPAFFNALTQRSGCGLLLDVNNLLVNARNRADGSPDDDPEAACRAWVDAIAPGTVGEIHVAGHTRTADGLCIDDHGSAVEDATWRLYHHARARFPEAPGLLEWDTDIPPLDTLLAEVQKAR